MSNALKKGGTAFEINSSTSITEFKFMRGKYLGVTEYKYVYKYIYADVVIYHAQIGKYKWRFITKSIHEAAVAVDKKLIQYGLDPINILKKK